MYDFFLYQGKDGKEKVTGPYVVLKLLETLPRKQRYRVVFDNWSKLVKKKLLNGRKLVTGLRAYLCALP